MSQTTGPDSDVWTVMQMAWPPTEQDMDQMKTSLGFEADAEFYGKDDNGRSVLLTPTTAEDIVQPSSAKAQQDIVRIWPLHGIRRVIGPPPGLEGMGQGTGKGQRKGSGKGGRGKGWACASGHMDKRAMSRLQDSEERTWLGYSLLYAAKDGCVDCVDHLLNEGVSANFESETQKYTPLDFALWALERKKVTTEKKRALQEVIDVLESSHGHYNHY